MSQVRPFALTHDWRFIRVWIPRLKILSVRIQGVSRVINLQSSSFYTPIIRPRQTTRYRGIEPPRAHPSMVAHERSHISSDMYEPDGHATRVTFGSGKDVAKKNEVVGAPYPKKRSERAELVSPSNA